MLLLNRAAQGFLNNTKLCIKNQLSLVAKYLVVAESFLKQITLETVE